MGWNIEVCNYQNSYNSLTSVIDGAMRSLGDWWLKGEKLLHSS